MSMQVVVDGMKFKKKTKPTTVQCPMCLRNVSPEVIIPTDLEVIRTNGKKTTIEAWLAECCATIFLKEDRK